MILQRLGCCGVMEVQHLSHSRGAREALIDFGGQAYNPAAPAMARFRYALFAEAQADNGHLLLEDLYGSNFAAFIRANNLGEVISTGVHINPNSSNRLRVWMWTVDHTAVRAWLLEHAPSVLAGPPPPPPPAQVLPDPNPLFPPLPFPPGQPQAPWNAYLNNGYNWVDWADLAIPRRPADLPIPIAPIMPEEAPF